MFTFLAVLFFVVGLFNIFAKDLMWNLTSTGAPLDGLPANPNETAGLWSTVCGIIAIVIGLVFWFYA